MLYARRVLVATAVFIFGWSFSAICQERQTQSSDQPPNTLSNKEEMAGWQLLFDGKTTDGWRGYKMDKMPLGWRVIDGAMVKVKPGAGGKGAGGGDDIITVQQFDNFEFTVQWRIVSNGNSGILYRVTEDAITAWHVAPEMQVLDNTKHPNRKKSQLAGALYDLYSPAEDATRPIGEWNTARVVANGKHVEHWLNGVKLLTYGMTMRSSRQWRT